MRRYAIIRAAYDDEAKVWYIENSDIPGLVTGAESLEGLRQRIRDILPDLLHGELDVPDELEVEVIARISDRVLTAA